MLHLGIQIGWTVSSSNATKSRYSSAAGHVFVAESYFIASAKRVLNQLPARKASILWTPLKLS